MASQTSIATTFGVGGAGVVASYLYLAQRSKNNSGYVDSALWLGQPRSVVYALVTLQLISAVGALVAFGSWIAKPPEGGILGSNSVALPFAISIFMISSIAGLLLKKGY